MTRQQILDSATEEQRQHILQLEQKIYQGRAQLLEIMREIPKALEEAEERRAKRWRYLTWGLLSGIAGWALGALIYWLWARGW